ncbi:class I SAM-dependent methyltransferase [Paraburkholderia caledonica]|uniref:class I SAM-dependent methyltransferase n=1 Tax=Paraburkholderia caledonica TaxID=134536 RepID=UPI0038BB8A4A
MTDNPVQFSCNVCSHTRFSRTVTRGDGRRVLFCENCEMGVIEAPPHDTSVFYGDDYYGKDESETIGYADYAFTAEHGLLWVQLFVRALKPAGRVLDIGCADGFLLCKLGDAYEKFGIEVNRKAADKAAAAGVTLVADDVFAPAVTEQFAGSLDVVTSIATFEHVLDLKRAFTDALSLLKPDGVLVFEIPLISETRDNSDWFNGSYEHIYYPTIPGMERLLSSFGDVFVSGFESDIKGYGSTYIGVATRQPELATKVEHLVGAMKQSDLQGLTEDEKALNLAYNVVHSFNPTPERVLALPLLIDRAYSLALVTRLSQLWYADSVNAVNAEWYEGQAKNWRDAYEQLEKMTTSGDAGAQP